MPHQSDALEARGCYQVESTTVLPVLPSRHDRLSNRWGLLLTLAANVEHLYRNVATAATLTGNTLANSLRGNAGDDTLIGLTGNDTLTGGDGKDSIRFDSLLNALTNLDTIYLENAIFTALTTTGWLAAESSRRGAVAVDADDYVIYDDVTGALYYDADGNGVAAAVQLAALSGAPVLTNADFLVT